MRKKLRLLIKQIFCFHEDQRYIGEVCIMGGGEKLTQWECTRCNSQRFSTHIPLITTTMTRYKYKGQWNIRRVVIHTNGGEDVYHVAQESITPLATLRKRRNVVK